MVRPAVSGFGRLWRPSQLHSSAAMSGRTSALAGTERGRHARGLRSLCRERDHRLVMAGAMPMATRQSPERRCWISIKAALWQSSPLVDRGETLPSVKVKRGCLLLGLLAAVGGCGERQAVSARSPSPRIVRPSHAVWCAQCARAIRRSKRLRYFREQGGAAIAKHDCIRWTSRSCRFSMSRTPPGPLSGTGDSASSKSGSTSSSPGPVVRVGGARWRPAVSVGT